MNRYENIATSKTEEGRNYTVNVIYPEIAISEEDTYITTSAGDRYDTLAFQFYGDPKLWWIIASVNTSIRSSLIVQPGIQLRIPANKERILQLYTDLNKNR